MAYSLISSELTKALFEIKSRIRNGLVTANANEIPESTKLVIAEAYKEFSKTMKQLTDKLNLGASGLHLKMGRYAPNGKYKSHLWGAIIPKSVKAPSYVTTQLYVFRSESILAWGIGPSDVAIDNPRFMKVYREAVRQDGDTVRAFFRKGFVHRNDLAEWESRNDKRYSDDVEGFFKSEHCTFARIFKADELPKETELNSMIETDFTDLLPFYLKIVAACSKDNLIDDLNRELGYADDKTESTDRDSEQSDSYDVKAGSDIQYWTIAPGESARLWDECREKSLISIGWDEMGDLNAYSSAEKLKEKFLEIYRPEKNPIMRVKGLFEFGHSIKPGDMVFVKEGVQKIIGYGKITSDYIFDKSRPEHKHIRKVEWISVGEWSLPEDERAAGKTLTNITRYPDFVQKLLALVGEKATAQIGGQLFSVEDAMKEVFIQLPEFQAMIDALNYKKNIILQGPPGVGKTFAAKRLAYSLIGKKDDSRIGFVQFHPSYSYEDFVQGIKPNNHGFQVKNGIFLDFCAEARKSDAPFVVIIDEINRGNLAKVLGELLMLVESDKRSEKVRLTYSQDGSTFSIPDNVFIIGTMNTADRSLSLVDYALRRRFLFFTLKPELKNAKFENHLKEMGLSDANIKTIQDKIGNLNALISADRRCLGSGFEIGHSYFSRKPKDVTFEAWFSSILALEIEPLLKEYWFDELDKVIEVTESLRAA